MDMKPSVVAVWISCGFGWSAAYAQDLDSRPLAEQSAYQKRFGIGSDIPNETELAQPVPVREVEGVEVRNGRGETLGTVDRVIRSGEKTYLVVAHQGFLGVEEGKAAFPVKRFAVGPHNHLIVRGVTKNDIAQMDRWRNPNFPKRRLDNHQLIFLKTIQ